jgi:uncharacterized protein
MARPVCCRRIAFEPGVVYFKPAGVPLVSLTEVCLSLDELEAVRLADFEGLYQDQAAKRMNVSRQTFGRIVEQGRKKIADALVNGKALKIEGGKVEMEQKRKFQCAECAHTFEVPYGSHRPSTCPECHTTNIHRSDDDTGGGGGGGRGRCRRMGQCQRKNAGRAGKGEVK